MNTVAFLGIGAMGDRLATNLLNAGYNLRVWNRTPQKCDSLVKDGAILCASPKEAAREANIIIARVNLLNQIPTTSPALKRIGLLIASENHQPLFPINLLEKDLGYVEQLGQLVNSEIPIVKKITEIYQQAKKAGYGEQNISGVAQLYL